MLFRSFQEDEEEEEDGSNGYLQHIEEEKIWLLASLCLHIAFRCAFHSLLANLSHKMEAKTRS